MTLHAYELQAGEAPWLTKSRLERYTKLKLLGIPEMSVLVIEPEPKVVLFEQRKHDWFATPEHYFTMATEAGVEQIVKDCIELFHHEHVIYFHRGNPRHFPKHPKNPCWYHLAGFAGFDEPRAT